MKQKIINIIKYNKTLLENMSFIAILKVFTLIFPLLTYPYLIRVLGKELYGTFIYAQAFIAYFTIIINFGFNISATKDVSIYRDDKDKLSEIVSSIYILKTLLFTLCFLVFVIIIFSVPFLRENYILYLLTYGITLGEVLLPVWFYQGIEKMKYMTYVNVGVKAIFTICIFIFIHSKEDYLYLPILLSLGAVIGGIFSFFLVFVKEGVKFKFYNFNILVSTLKRTFPFFLSRLSGVLSSETNTIVIGSFMGMGEVAYYDLAKKITNLLLFPNSIINTAVYPKIAKLKDLIFVKKVFFIRIGISILLFIALLVGGEIAILKLGGSDMLPAYNSIVYYGLYIIISAISYYVGGTVLVSFDYEKEFNYSVIYGFIFYAIFMGGIVLFNVVSLFNVISVFLVVELMITMYRYYYCKKYKLL